MKTKEQLAEDKGLVRDLIAGLEGKLADDYERNYVDGLCKKAFSELAEMQIPHVRRIHEALFAMDFPSVTALGLRRAVANRIATHHNLKSYRLVKVPVITPPATAT